MAARKKSPPKEWSGKKDTEKALFSPRAEEAWCSLQTAFWLTERVNVDVPLMSSWNGLTIYHDKDLRPGTILARRGERKYHVRIEAGEVHEGHPDQCDDEICLAERVMDS
jgi:hypothetical protein